MGSGPGWSGFLRPSVVCRPLLSRHDPPRRASLSVFASLVAQLAELLQPYFASAATAAAIVLFTALVRLALLPLSRAAARGQKARIRLAPQMAALKDK